MIKKDPEILTKRYKLVGDYIRDIIKEKVVLPTALVSVIYMYYDDWDGIANEEWTTLSAFEAVNEIVYK